MKFSPRRLQVAAQPAHECGKRFGGQDTHASVALDLACVRFWQMVGRASGHAGIPERI